MMPIITSFTREMEVKYMRDYGGKPPNMKEISLQADKLFGASRDGLWVGFRIKPAQSFTLDEEEEHDQEEEEEEEE